MGTETSGLIEGEDESFAKYEVHCEPPKLGAIQGELNNVFAHWEEIKFGRFAPSWRDFCWQRMPPKLIPWFAVVDVKYAPMDFIYRFWGTARTRIQGKDYTGKSVKDFRPLSISKKALSEYQQVVDQKLPLHLTTSGLTNFKNEPFTYHFLV